MTMEQVAWTVIGLLAASFFGNFWFLGSKIDSINNRIDSINNRIDSLAARLDSRLDSLTDQVQAHIERHAS
jgi:hypothetical protein